MTISAIALREAIRTSQCEAFLCRAVKVPLVSHSMKRAIGQSAAALKLSASSHSVETECDGGPAASSPQRKRPPRLQRVAHAANTERPSRPTPGEHHTMQASITDSVKLSV